MKHRIIITALVMMTFSACSQANTSVPINSSPTNSPISEASVTSAPTATFISLPTATVEPTATSEITTGVVWPTTMDQGNQIIQKILAALADSGMELADVVSYTDASDPNTLLGRPHQYIAKVVWRDPNIAAEGEPGVDTGGTIEVFLNQADLQTRYDYIDSISSSSSLFAEYHYQNAPAFLRLSTKYLPSQAQKIADAFLALVFNK